MSGRHRSEVPHDPIDFRLLRYFLAVHQTGSFSRAAEQTGVSQPNISAQIGRLEKSLKAKLLQRGGSRVLVSPTGLLFCRYALGIIRLTDDLRRQLAASPDQVEGKMRIAVAPPLNIAAVPTLLGAFSAAHPRIDITVEEMDAPTLEAALGGGRVDVGLGFAAVYSHWLRQEILATDEFAWVVHESHPWARRRSLHLSELSGQRVVALPPRFLVRQRADDILREHRVRPCMVAEIGGVGALLRALAPLRAGALLPRGVLSQVDDIRAIPLRDAGLALELRLTTCADSSTRGVVEDFAKLAREMVPDLAADSTALRGPRSLSESPALPASVAKS